MVNFAHLHVHTEYSLLDGLASISKIFKKAHALGQPAVAITDHGNMYGSVSFYDACASFNKALKDSDPDAKPIKPIFGTEFYVCDDLTVKTRKANPDDESDRRHLVLLVKNEIGYKNISYLNAVAFRDGYYYKPRIDLKTLKEHSEGLICLSACIGGDIPQAILRRNFDKAEELVRWFKDVFGEDFYLEMQYHGLREELEVNQYLRQYSRKYGVKLVITNDVHYIDKEDAIPHDVLLCVQTGRDYDDPTRMRFNSDDYYMKSYEELKALFPVIEGASESEDIPFYSEVYRSESGKVAYAIPYVEAEPEYYYSTGSSEDYDTVRFDSGYDSIDDIKALAQTVYSRNYCLSLYSVLFDGIALGDSIQLAQYSEVASVGGSFLGQLREYEPLFTEQRVYMFETARINKWGSNSKFVRVLINSYLPSAPNQIIETEIDLVLQDGVWLLDVPTF